MNNSLLYDSEYVSIVKDTLKKTTCQYAVVNDDPDFFLNATTDEINTFYASQAPESLQLLKLNINPELFLETLLMMEIRRVTILFASNSKRKRIQKEKELYTEIEALEKSVLVLRPRLRLGNAL